VSPNEVEAGLKSSIYDIPKYQGALHHTNIYIFSKSLISKMGSPKHQEKLHISRTRFNLQPHFVMASIPLTDKQTHKFGIYPFMAEP
jgi:hypothetical protein